MCRLAVPMRKYHYRKHSYAIYIIYAHILYL